MDLIEQHLAGTADPHTDPLPDCAALLRDCDSAELAEKRISQAFALVRQHPAAEELQVAAARLLELTRRRDNMLDTWTALSRRFPDNQLALRMQMRWLRRESRQAEGIQALRGRFGDRHDAALAELLAELGEFTAADAIFESLLAQRPDDTRLRLGWAKLLQSRGELARALVTVKPLRSSAGLSQTARALMEKLDAAENARRAVDPEILGRMTLPSAALHQSILTFSGRQIPPSASPNLGGIAFVTGTLGAGGAERQLTRLACALHELQERRAEVDGIRLQGAVEMVITSVAAAVGNDFFLPQARAAGIGLTVLSDIEPEPVDDVGLPDGALSDLATILPKNTLFGLQRLVGHFRRSRPEVVYIWQDGAVLMAALAALVARIPRVVISLRGMPPNLRRNLAKDEFLGMYQALVRVPGVSLSSNSHAAAVAYADWIAIAPDEITVVHNAIESSPALVEPGELSMWRRFEAATAGASLTMGGIFRFDPNKRPLQWVEFAAAACGRNRDLRCIIVGSGAALEQAKHRAAELGIAERLLFTGHSRNVGFWLSKMTFLTLLSEFEGLPNVLIEAQLAGVPVISTPAGGATETFIPGRTGLVLNSAVRPDPADFLAKMDQLLASRSRLRFMGHIARDWAQRQFSLDAILGQTVRLFKQQPVRGEDAVAAVPLSQTA